MFVNLWAAKGGCVGKVAAAKRAVAEAEVQVQGQV